MPLTEKELIENSWPLGLASEGNQNLDEDNLCCFTNEALQVIHSKDRALWLARAEVARISAQNWANSINTLTYYCGKFDNKEIEPREMLDKWQWVERKCRQKAEEFK